MQYLELCKVYEELEATSKRLIKTYIVSQFLRQSSDDELGVLILLLQGRLFSLGDERNIGIAAKMLIKAIAKTSGNSAEEVEAMWAKKGDLGLVAQHAVEKRRQATLFCEALTVRKVFETLHKAAVLEGGGSVELKVGLLAELLSNAKPLEARYVIRTVLEDLRVGVGPGVLRDAVIWSTLPPIIGIFSRCEKGHLVPGADACVVCNAKIKSKFKDELTYFSDKKDVLRLDAPQTIQTADLQKHTYSAILLPDEKLARDAYNIIVNLVQYAYDLSTDFAKVIITLRTKGLAGLEDISLTIGKPVKVMLYQKAKDMEDAFRIVGTPAALEYKYDGFRLAVHRDKAKGILRLFTRRLEDVTAQFPDISELVKEHIDADEYIIEGEVIGIDPKTKKWLPFQQISQRIIRKYNIDEMAKQVPVMLNVFDVLQVNGKNMIKAPFRERRAALAKIVKPVANRLSLAKEVITSDLKEAKEFYEEALAKGNEGVMAKNLDAIYKPGSRVGFGVKVKPIMETLDLVITRAEWGTGKRVGWLTSFTIACYDEESGDFLEIGKVGTGFKEKGAEEGAQVTDENKDNVSFEELTNILKPLIKYDRGKEVVLRPEVVIEVSFEEIQKSTNYNSGYALRFPRVVRLRTLDRTAADASSLQVVDELFNGQRGKK